MTSTRFAHPAPERLPGMLVIERKVMDMIRKKGATVSHCGWTIAGGSAHATPYRLDISIGNRAEKIYFTEQELARCAERDIGDYTLLRLYRVLSRIDDNKLPLAISSLKDAMARVRP